MDLIREHPEFRYSMECVAYLREFLDRHPERREEMAQLMRTRKFVWGASYVKNLEVHVGAENLVRQFYLGRPGCTRIFQASTPLSISKQIPPPRPGRCLKSRRRQGSNTRFKGDFRNYPLVAFAAPGALAGRLPADGEFLHIEPRNMIMTVLKKSEDDDSIVLRFFEVAAHPE
jgi:hypothetical protein